MARYRPEIVKPISRRKLLRVAALAAPALILPGKASAWTHGSSFPIPAVAAANGLNTQLFFDHFTSSSTFDLAGTGNPGYNWYLNTAWPSAYQPFANYSNIASAPPYNPADISVANSVVTLSNGIPVAGAGSACGFGVQTAQASGASYVGKGFTPPIYIEWQMSVSVLNQNPGGIWPATWTTAIDWMLGNTNQQTEVDGMEYLGGDTDFNVHYWNFLAQNQSQISGTGTTLIQDTNFHIYGVLWIPATPSTDGVINRYFDGSAVTSQNFSYSYGSQGATSDAMLNMLIITPAQLYTAAWDYVGVWGM